MSIAIGQTARQTPVFFSFGFRPFFLAAALWSALALSLWILALFQGLELPSRFDPLTWHIHEMLFGFVLAAIAGFLLTAVANWTGRAPVRGAPLAILASAWLLGRIACLVSTALLPGFVIAADLCFPALLVLAVGHEIVAAKNWRNLPMILPVLVLGVANLIMHLEIVGAMAERGLGWRLGLVAILVLISAVAGRIVPSFTRNWLVRRGATKLPPPAGAVDRVALAMLHTGLLAWAFFPAGLWVGALLIGAALANAWRLARWRGLATLPEPLLAVLHLGYGWLTFGTGLLGVSIIAPSVPQSAAIHALTAGAIGTMILAVMTRATLGHTGRALVADRMTVAIYGLVTLAAVVRIVAACTGLWTMPLLAASAILWIGAFLLFVGAYGPMLVRPRRPAAA